MILMISIVAMTMTMTMTTTTMIAKYGNDIRWNDKYVHTEIPH